MKKYEKMISLVLVAASSLSALFFIIKQNMDAAILSMTIMFTITNLFRSRTFKQKGHDKKKDADVMFQLAECYRASREYVLAATYYDKAYKQDKKNLLALYHYAEMLKIYGYYADAKKCFNRRKTMLSNTLYKLTAQKKLKIAYFGGSILDGACASDMEKTSCRALTTKWFRESYPDAVIEENNA